MAARTRHSASQQANHTFGPRCNLCTTTSRLVMSPNLSPDYSEGDLFHDGMLQAW